MAADDIGILWQEARQRYADISGKDLKDLPMPKTTEELLSNVEKQNKDYKHFRERSGTLFAVLSAAVKPIELVGNLAAGAASAAFPPSSMCFGAVMYLINAARGVSASLDAIADLLGTLKDFTVRLTVYKRENLSQELREKLTQILTTVIEIFARSTKAIKEGVLNRMKTFGKNLLLGNDTSMQSLIGKLDKLTESEDRLVGAETLVESKRTGRNVDAVQVTLTQNTVHLKEMSLTQNEMAQGVGQILSVLEESKVQAKKEKDVKHMEAVKRVLKPSVAPQDRFDEIRREHIEHSGDWICAEDAFTSWSGSEAPILWVSGMPGSGKSFLTYTMITHLRSKFSDEEGAAGRTSIGFTFFRDNKEQTRSLEQALHDIAFQLAQTDELYAKHICECVHSDSDVSTIRSAWQKLFVDFFISGSEQTDSSAFIIFDGMDESFEEGRETFFELLQDVEGAGPESRLRVAILGRPQVLNEIADHLDQQMLHRIHVNSEKNGGDIAHYVEASISKSRALKQLSRELKDEIVQSLTSKANGMFMWVRLMLAELSKKSRPSAIKDALNKAPKGLAEMLKHVLAGVSASIKDPQDAVDLNDLLMWVAIAKRPMLLGELDSMLRLKSPEGEGVLNLEGKLRIQYASFFVLTREDALNTADLQASKKDPDQDIDDDAQAGAEVIEDDGLDDVENDTEFNSNPKTTSVSFVHASISDFFRDPKQGKVSAGGEAPSVGVVLDEAALSITKTCLEVLINDSLLKRMEQSVSLRTYATYWKEHLEELDRTKVDSEDRKWIGSSILDMLRDDKLIPRFAWCRACLWFGPKTASGILPWLLDSDLTSTLPDDTVSWLKSCEANPVELFEPTVRFCAIRWLKPAGWEWNLDAVPHIVWTYIQRKNGTVVDEVPKLTGEQVIEAAEWTGFERNAEWHRLLGRTLRENENYDAALEHFQQAAKLNPQLWLALAGIAKIHRAQDKLDESIEANEEVLRLAAIENEKAGKDKNFQTVYIHQALAECYEEVADENDTGEPDADLAKVVKYNQLALTHYLEAFKLNNNDYDSVDSCIGILYFFSHLESFISDENPSQQQDALSVASQHGLQPPVSYQEQTMDLLHDMAETQKDERHTNLTKCLFEYKFPDGHFFSCIAIAAHATEQFEWLQGRYREAISAAIKDLQHVVAASLSLCLAELYVVYGDEPDRAVRIWERIGTEGSGSAKLETDIAWTRQWALNQLGMYCLRTALDDDAKVERLIPKMERILSRKRHGMRYANQDKIPPSDMAKYLAFWYRKQGRLEEVQQLVRPHIKDAILILSDDDPSNDGGGFYDVSRAFLATGDAENFLAAMYANRRYKDGLAVLEDDQEDDVDTEPEDAAQEEGQGEDKGTAEDGDDDNESTSSDDDEDDGVGGCDGPCREDEVDIWDGMTSCLICGDFCESKGCYKKLLAGEIPGKKCGDSHEAIRVPVLETRFKKGETMIGDKVITLDEWKAGLKKQWGL